MYLRKLKTVKLFYKNRKSRISTRRKEYKVELSVYKNAAQTVDFSRFQNQFEKCF